MAIINGTAGVNDSLVSLNDGDVLNGLDGDDTLTAAHNNVALNGGSGNDVLLSSEVGADSTTMDGGSGGDTLGGGGTNDTASYANDTAGVVVNLSSFSAIQGPGGTDGIDILLGIENVTGSAFNDSLTGDDGANVLQGGAGNDTLAGNGGNDVFKYSFTPTPGQGSTFTFTEWLSEKYDENFGPYLPDYAPAHKHDDKHQSKDDDHGNNDQRDNHGKDDGHHSNDGDHDHDWHGGGDGHHDWHGGLTENFFETNYQQWLKEVVVADLLEQGFVLDANGNGKIKININEDSPYGTPRIEGLTKAQLDDMFGDRDSVILNDDCKAEKAWYSNTFTSGNGPDTVASTDGVDTIVGFTSGDTLNFNGITQQQFLDSFNVASGADTVITIDGVAGWSVTLVGVSAFDASADAVFS